MMFSLKKLSNLPGLKQLPVLAELSFVQGRNASSYDHKLKYGQGGRLSFNGNIVTVLGGTGFVGRKVVNRLAKAGTQLVVPYRGSEDDIRSIRVMGDLGQIVFLYYDVRDYESLLKTMTHSTCVVNMVGRNFATRNFSLENVLVDAPSLIAKAAAECGVPRLIHMSHLCAAEDSPSNFMRLKAKSERDVAEIFPDVTIFKAAETYGDEDKYLNKYAYLRTAPFIPFPNEGWNTIKRPVFAGDVAHAVTIATLDKTTAGKVYELPGPEPYYLYDIMEYSLRLLKKNIRTLPYPMALYKFIGRLGELSIWDPKLTEDGVIREFLTEPVTEDALTFQDLGITPTNLNDAAISVLRRHRDFFAYDEMVMEDDVIRAAPVK